MKDLKNLPLAELWQLFPIILAAHNPAYAAWYAEEEEALLALLSPFEPLRINHIGSTAVEGLMAKPIVDILLELPYGYAQASVAGLLEQNGWLVMAKAPAQQTLALNKGYTPQGFAERVFHLHIKPIGDWGELYFRDYLRAHPAARTDYARLKQTLQRQFEHDRDAYTVAKTAFILRHTGLARAEFAGRYNGAPPPGGG